jgi:hypothetical protein
MKREGGRVTPVAQIRNSTSQPKLQAIKGELEAARREVAHLHAALAASERQREEVTGQLAAERAQAAALRAQEGSIASSHRELQEAWKGMVGELKAQLKVRGGRHSHELPFCLSGQHAASRSVRVPTVTPSHQVNLLTTCLLCGFRKPGGASKATEGGGVPRGRTAPMMLQARYHTVLLAVQAMLTFTGGKSARIEMAQ